MTEREEGNEEATRVVVLGAGYGGCAAVQSLEGEREDRDIDIVWVSATDHHLVLHEAHRCLRTPSVAETISIPVEEVKSPATRFVEATVTGLDVDERRVELDDHDDLAYDYAVVGLGSQTAFFGIDGLEDHALTLKSLDDALTITDRLRDAAREATRDDPAQVVVGGGGLTGIQTAGEIAAWREDRDAPVEVHLVERSGEVFPGHDHEFQGAIQNRLEAHDVHVDTGTAVSSVEDDTIRFEERDPFEYDVLVWAGGVTGQAALDDADVDKEHNRLYTGATLETSDDRVFAIGDSALVHQDADEGPLTEEAIWDSIADEDLDDVPPPTAEAAWEEGQHIGENVVRAIDGRDRRHWAYMNKGTLVSVGDDAVAHDVVGVPLNTFGGPGARVIKKAISARWIATVGSWRRAARAWPNM
ncbi:NAD(P)/FAD-dependent oxidoreductase [Halomarina salina]|uniref:NADH:ubiquinone reductase (non-electrogenic) n=1 Tax=Halomarina salina TaxID=1872699 RepID=A0ABD5RQE9_9EURY|nr:FAD-dependent oxidoreductase [Halomarina salina]